MRTNSITIGTHQMNPASGAGVSRKQISHTQAPTIVMAVQSAMNAAFSTLRGAVGNDKKQKKVLNNLRDAFKAVEADELPRSEMVERGMRLTDLISESVTSLHETRPRPTLAFCAAALSWLFEAKFEPTLESGNEEGARAWEDLIFRGIMQPILTIVDSEDQAVVGNVLYKVICAIMRSPWSHGFGGRFARSLALVLVCTCSTPSNKAMLLDPSVFGTDALSKLIIDAKDYHYLDTILELSFTMYSSQGGKMTRKTYADSIFSSGYALDRLPDEISSESASIHSVTNSGNSEKHVLDIMRTMSRAGIERPQVFMTKDLSYCGTRISQTPPSNVIILDHENLCIVFCDKNGVNDVFATALTTIKGVELVPQNASRILVELMIAKSPLISSSREELAIPDSYIPGSPLKIRFSIASSDVLGLEAALVARDLAGMIKDDNALTRNSSLASMKISNAVSSIPLKKNSNPSNEQAEEMIRKYVNLPSSRDGSLPPTESIIPTIRATLPPRAPITLATVTRPVASPPTEKPHNEPAMPHTVDERALISPVPAPAGPASSETAGSGAPRIIRTAAKRSKHTTEVAALVGADSSELTDSGPDTKSENNRKKTAIKTPADDTTVLPTPPRTRARAQQTKHVAKTLVPSTPTRDDPPEVSSPPDVPTPSPKPVRKRKLVEDNPFELPPLRSERPAKQKKIKDTMAISGSQHIRLRDTAATRVKAKYGTVSKKMRASSPIESISSSDGEGEDLSPRKEAPVVTERKKRGVKATNATRMRPHSDKDDNVDVPKHQTRASATKAKPKPAASSSITKLTQGKTSGLDAVVAPEAEVADPPEPPKRKRGRPPKNKLTQQPATLPKFANNVTVVVEQASSHSEGASNIVKSTSTDGSTKAEPTPVATTDEMTAATPEDDREDDDLLERLSQAAKKALKPLAMDNQSAVSPPHSLSPVVTPNIELEDPGVDIGTLEPPTRCLESDSAEGFTHQTQSTTIKPVETTSIRSTPKLPCAHVDKGPQNIDEILTGHPDAPKDSTPKYKNHPNSTQASTRLQTAQESPSHHTCNQVPMDIPEIQKSAPVLPQPTKAAASKATPQQDPKRTPTVTRVETHAPTLEEDKPTASPKTLVRFEPTRITECIQPEETRAAMTQTVVRQVETPPVKDTRRTKLPPVFIPVDSDVEMEPFQEPISHQASVEPIRRPSTLEPRHTPIVQPVAKPQFHPVTAATKVKHSAVTRILFDTATQPSPRSALASPQRRTLTNGIRPSVSFLEPPAPIPRHGSSNSSSERTSEQRSYCVDHERLREGHSTHTSDVILQIADIMMEIQETIALNLGEKIQTINIEARNAHTELTKSVVEEFDRMKTESDSHHAVLHKFESVFASQAQAVLKGLGRVVERDDQINNVIGNIIAANARAGQSIAKSTLDFQVPKLFGAFLAS